MAKDIRSDSDIFSFLLKDFGLDFDLFLESEP